MKTYLPLLVAIFAAAGSLAALPEPSPEELDYARKKFAVWRQYPEQLAKLRQAARTFAELPAARQEQIDKLDLDLSSEASAVQARLHDVLDRYNDWLAKLPEKDRERIRGADGKQARLAIIKELRQDEWLRQQPAKTREAIEAMPAAARPAALEKARAEDRKHREEWTIARRFWDDLSKKKPLPSKLSDFDDEKKKPKGSDFDLPVRTYVNDVLRRLLSDVENDELIKAEGTWPLYPQTLVKLADAHPPALPGPTGPRALAELPKAVRDSLAKKGFVGVKEKAIEKKFRGFEGRYPQFAVQLTNFARETGWIMPLEWWAYSFNSLSPPMQNFLKTKLAPLLDRKQERLLIEAEGKWPEYPEMIQKLAQAHNLRAPWFTLPGNRERWDAYRAGPQPTVQGFPELPKYKLRDFAFFDLDDLDRIKFKNEIDRIRSKNDTEAWAYLVDLYFESYPNELTRLRRIDREKQGLKGP
jgi:hypothetical protein